ncbi:MAG: hypothetical protein JWN40_786 [Phycisphaerales bacterium]|nr:hypothetical protein [Phycisphaerales bacterium]
MFRDDRQVTDPATLSSLVPLSYADELFSDYLADANLDDALIDAIVPSGKLRFDYDGESTVLRVSTEYQTRRPLTPLEIQALVEYTKAQWSDGIGENWVAESVERVGYCIQCVTFGDGLPDEYPWVDLDN